MSSLAFNTALDHSKKTWGALTDRLRRYPSNGFYGLDSYGFHNPESKAEAIGRMLEVRQIMPDKPLAYRLFTPNRDNPNNGDNHQLFLEPDEWGYHHRELAGTGIYCLANNEPTHWDFQRTANWLLEVAKIAKARNLKVALGGFNVGGYEEYHIPLLEPLLEYMAANPGLAMLDCHEYFRIDAYGEVASGVRDPSAWPRQVDPAALWHLGRYKRILAYCERERIARPDVMIGEWGPDKIDEVGGGIAICRGIWAGYGYDPDWYHAEMLKWADDVIYTEPQVKLKAFYQYSDPDSGNWPDHNAGRFSRFMDETRTGFRDMATPTYQGKAPGVYTMNGNGVRVRAGANTTALIVDTVNSGEYLTVISDGVAVADDYGWQQVAIDDKQGWMALHGTNVTWSLKPAPAEPVPDVHEQFADAMEVKALGMLELIDEYRRAIK